MKREPVIRCMDTHLLSENYFIATKQALLANPDVNNIHFVITTNHNNLKLVDVDWSERYFRYDVQVDVELKEIRSKHDDPDLYTSAVLLELFEKYKRNLVLH